MKFCFLGLQSFVLYPASEYAYKCLLELIKQGVIHNTNNNNAQTDLCVICSVK